MLIEQRQFLRFGTNGFAICSSECRLVMKPIALSRWIMSRGNRPLSRRMAAPIGRPSSSFWS